MRVTIREPVNGLTHLLGAIVSAAGLAALVAAAVARGSARHTVAFAIFGTSLVAMYTASALYHSLPLSPRGLRIFRRVDHMMIYVLIAGTYTPVCLVLLRGRLGIGLLAAVWALAAVGVALKVAWIHAPRWLSTLLYLAMGWIAVLVAPPLLAAAPAGFFGWLLAGGLFYSVGAVVYGTKWPNVAPGVFGSHELWHLFVMAGSFSHYWAMLTYLSRTA